MAGPYFKGQTTQSPCGCFYPDVTRRGEDPVKQQRVLHCWLHGEQCIPYPPGLRNVTVDWQPVPTDEWRGKERQRLRAASVRRGC
ncbi:hypothetical protein HY933_03240 [Candidatus Falkowbacteria bacterium]|nr:hypothetical protein [Candidatus Falkowbacteria bacterium]